MHCSLRNVVLNNVHDPLAVNTLITTICYENALLCNESTKAHTVQSDLLDGTAFKALPLVVCSKDLIYKKGVDT